mmetsp:Transcript_89963/g.290679  ORF Transcript_89963/g.290679 Transcript_89963/m.290679 type:complete len:222 (-) Transcript_89963:194-859(-)
MDRSRARYSGHRRSDCAESASRKVGCRTCSFANDQAVFVNSWTCHWGSLRTAAYAIAVSSGTSDILIVANDHAVFDMGCAPKWRILLMADAEIASNKGTSEISTVANAQAVFARFCGSHCEIRATDAYDIAESRGTCFNERTDKAQAVFDKCCMFLSASTAAPPPAPAPGRKSPDTPERSLLKRCPDSSAGSGSAPSATPLAMRCRAVTRWTALNCASYRA